MTLSRAFFGLALLLLLGSVTSGCQDEPSKSAATARRDADPEAVRYLLKAQQLSRQGRYRAALALADSAKRRAPNLADVHFLRGRIFTELRRYREADRSYQHVLELDPEYQGVWFNRGNNAFRRGQYRNAVSYYQREYEQHPEPVVSFHMGRAYDELGKADKARRLYRRTLSEDSSYVVAYSQLGLLYEQEGELEKALKMIRRASQMNPENVDYRYKVGALTLQLGDTERAREILEQIVAEHPGHYGAQYNLGMALSHLGRDEAARRHIETADSLEQRQKRIEQLQTLADMHQDEPRRWVSLGNALYQSGEVGRAVKAYEIAVSLAPRNLAWKNNLAALQQKQGDLEAAIALYQDILRQDAGMANVWYNLGIAYSEQDQDERARKAWEKAVRLDSTHSGARARLDALS